MIIELTPDQVHYVLLGLRTAAEVSRQNGHNDQADDFSDLAEQVRLQAQKQADEAN